MPSSDPRPSRRKAAARLERGGQVRGERRAIEDEGRLRGRGDLRHRDVDVLQRDAGPRAQRHEAELGELDGQRRAGHRGGEAQGAARRRVHRRQRARLHRDRLRAPGARRGDRPVLDGERAGRERESIDVHGGRRLGRGRPAQQIGDVQLAALGADDAHPDAVDGRLADVEAAAEQRARGEAHVQPIDLRQRGPGLAVGEAEAADLESTPREREIEALDRDPAARHRLDLAHDEPSRDAGQLPPEGRRREHQAKNDDCGDRPPAPAHLPSMPRPARAREKMALRDRRRCRGRVSLRSARGRGARAPRRGGGHWSPARGRRRWSGAR